MRWLDPGEKRPVADVKGIFDKVRAKNEWRC